MPVAWTIHNTTLLVIIGDCGSCRLSNSVKDGVVTNRGQSASKSLNQGSSFKENHNLDAGRRTSSSTFTVATLLPWF